MAETDYSNYDQVRATLVQGISGEPEKVRLNFNFLSKDYGDVLLTDFAHEVNFEGVFKIKRREDNEQYHIWMDFEEKLLDTRLHKLSSFNMDVKYLNAHISYTLHP